jgi:hypothetical protein
MSPRFEVLHNGQRVCIAGVDGDGVVTVGLTYAKRPDTAGSTDFHVGGLGCFQGQAGEQHVSWVVPAIGEGDEITIRVRSGGEFDPPLELTPHPQHAIEDPEFGTLRYSNGAWDGDIPFPTPPFERAHVHIIGDEAGPSAYQRRLVHELLHRHSQLWPAISSAILKCTGRCRSVSEGMDCLSPEINIGVPLDPHDLSLTYRLNGDPEGHACGITLRDWEIVEIYRLY